MLNKRIFLFLFLGIFLISLLGSSQAYFYKSHEFWTLKAFSQTSSPITQLCGTGNNYEAFKTGVLAADVPVLHYFDKKVSSYVGTHSKGAGLASCLSNADTDEEKCFCYGETMHWVAQDRYSHLQEGVVYKYLKSEGGLNFLGHMTIERDFENKHMEYVKNDPIVTSGKLEQYDSTALDYLFEEYGGNPELLSLLSQQAGIDLTNDARIFRSGYQGEGFYSTVYKDKVSLPYWFWLIPIILIIFGLFLVFASLKFGKGFWKWMLLIYSIVIVIFALVILISIFQGTTWKLTTIFIEIPPKFGYLSVSQEDIVYYDQIVTQATIDYLKTGNVVIVDGSGLSYEQDGQLVKGALSEAQQVAQYIIYPIALVIFLYMNYVFISLALGLKVNVFNRWVGKSLIILFMLVILIFSVLMLQGVIFG